MTSQPQGPKTSTATEIPPEIKEAELPDVLPVLPMKELVIAPGIMVPLVFHDEAARRCIDEVAVGDKFLCVVAQRPPREDVPPDPDNLYGVGTAAVLLQMLTYPDNSTRVLIQGKSRVRLDHFVETEPFFKAKVTELEEINESTDEVQALARGAVNQFEQVVALVPHLPDELRVAVLNISDPGKLADFIASNLNLSPEEKQSALESLSVQHRLEMVSGFLRRELELLELGTRIQDSVQTEMNKSQREYYLREQLKAIRRELGEEDEQAMEVKRLRETVENIPMPDEARKETERELDRLSRMSPNAAEYTVARTYIEWMIDLPWSISTEDNLDIHQAQEILDADHYGLKKVKERIVEHLSVRTLKPEMKGPILCFVGPPGVGKTSLGKSIARALGRRFVRLAIGGVRDEAEIRGHRRTYVGALPGRIIQSIRKAGSNNPLFMLDEVDKLGSDFRGDPSSALLEVLDPEQNYTFTDHYLDVPFDLSRVLFITTANLLDPIPGPLRDRMEIITLPGYIEQEKLEIAKRYLVPRQIEANGLMRKQIRVNISALRKIVREYTREAGVRNLEREIGGICRKVARKVAEGHEGKTSVKAGGLRDMLGPRKFFAEEYISPKKPGIATGLAWTSTGGEVLSVESTVMRGGRGLKLTGQLGDVMKESAQAALSYIRTRADKWKLDPELFNNHEIHIHVPAGAIPKDGPSAGVTMATSLLSLLTERAVKAKLAMTGEITLQGRVLRVGGVKEKVLAAHLAGVRTVILPQHCMGDLEEVPEDTREKLTFIPVKSLEEVFDAAFAKKTPKRKGRRKKTAAGRK